MFYRDARAFIEKVIRIRAHLNKTNKSLRSKGISDDHIRHLKLHLQAYPYNKDEYMANFFYRNAHKIKYLIPSRGKICRLDTEFDELFCQATQLKTINDFQL